MFDLLVFHFYYSSLSRVLKLEVPKLNPQQTYIFGSDLMASPVPTVN